MGGADFFNDPALAVIDAPNLTPGQGGVGAHFSDADWVRAIRHGIDPTGRPLLIMPSRNYYHLSDEDLGKVIAYLKHALPGHSVTPSLHGTPVTFKTGASHITLSIAVSTGDALTPGIWIVISALKRRALFGRVQTGNDSPSSWPAAGSE